MKRYRRKKRYNLNEILTYKVHWTYNNGYIGYVGFRRKDIIQAGGIKKLMNKNYPEDWSLIQPVDEYKRPTVHKGLPNENSN